jgi:hypothetical protein
MRHHSVLPRQEHPAVRVSGTGSVGVVEEQSYFQSTGCMKSSASLEKSSQDRATLRAIPVSP